MGRDFKALQNSNDILVQNYNSLLEPTRSNAIYFTSNLVFPPWFIRALPWKKTLELDRITGSLRSYCLDLVHERQDEIKSDRAIDKMDILTLLIKSNDFKDTELADQMLTFLAAGCAVLLFLYFYVFLSSSYSTLRHSPFCSSLTLSFVLLPSFLFLPFLLFLPFPTPS